MAAPPSPATAETATVDAPQEPLQSMMAIGRQQGWGTTAAGTQAANISQSEQGEQGSTAAPSWLLHEGPSTQKRLSATPTTNAAAAAVVAITTPAHADGTPAVSEVRSVTPPFQPTPVSANVEAMLVPSGIGGGDNASLDYSESAAATGHPTVAAFDASVQHPHQHPQQQQQQQQAFPFPNTNGLCEAIVTAARYNAAATAPTMPASTAMCGGHAAVHGGDSAKLYTATGAVDGRAERGPQAGEAAGMTRLSMSRPFGSCSEAEDPLQSQSQAAAQQQQQRQRVPQTSALNNSTSASGTTTGSGGESGVVALAGQQAVTTVAAAAAATGATSAAGAAAVAPPTPGGAEMQRMLSEARQAYTAAEKRLLDDGLALIEDWLGTRDLFFAAGSLFAVVGEADTAARCLLHATFINRAFHNEEEALTTLAMSVEQLKQAHPRIAVDSLLRLAPCYERRDLRFQAARCYREAAEILENVLEEKEEAVVKYRAALDMYMETKVAAAATALQWAREQRHLARKAEEEKSSAPSADVLSITNSADTSTTEPHITGASRAMITGPAAAATTTPDAAVSALEVSRISAGISAVPSAPVVSSTSSGRDQGGVAPRGPPQYRVSTTVQRTLADACRWRLAVLLTRLHRYEEVQETMLGCAASVPRDLPRTKYLLYATLCVLARGAARPTEGDAAGSAGAMVATAAAAQAETAAPRMSFAFAPSPEAEAADTVYFDSLYDGEKFFLALQDEDRTLQRGKENALVRALLAANRACSLTAFDEAVRTYRAYSTTEPCIVFELLITECRRSLFEHVERFS